MEIILLLIISLIMGFFALYIAFLFFNRPIIFKERETLISFIILIIITIINYFIFTNFIRVFLNFIVFALVCKYVFKFNLIKCFFVSAVTIIYLFIAEIIYSLLLVIFTNFNIIGSNEKWLGVLPGSIYVVIIAFILLRFKPLMSFFLSFKKHGKAEYNEIGIITILVIGILANKNVKLLGANVDYVMNLFLIIIFVIILFYLLKERENRIQLSLKYDHLFNCVHKYEKELINKSIITHEFKNQLIVIKGINNNKDKELTEYLDSIARDFKKPKLRILENMEHIPKGGLKGLIYYKLGDLEEEKINVLVTVSPTIKKTIFINMKPEVYRDIIKIIGIYLDNAIEAARECQKKQITLEMHSKQNHFHFILSNTYNNQIDVEKINKRGYSTKGKNRGYGLAIVNKLIDKYNFIEQKIDLIDDYFISHLIINLKNISI